MRWSVFARVIDNWGDVGVAWRLARALHARGERVRLVIDDASALAWMAPGRGREPRVEPWPGDPAAVSDVAVETFGCGLPEGVRADVFVNVEHLTAEPFAALSHGLPSPVGGRTTWFYYPGFDAGTGGLLGPPIAAAPAPAERTVTAFGYPNAAWPALLERLAGDGVPTRVLAFPGGATASLRLALGPSLARGALRVEPAGFASQDGYDRLLAGATLNLVRGEDSLVRAIRAGRPFLWQAYVQDDGAHAAKVRAFAERYARDAPAPLGQALARAFAAWNGLAPPGPALPLPDLDAWAAHARAFADALAAQPDLAERLVDFARLKCRALRPSDAQSRSTP